MTPQEQTDLLTKQMTAMQQGHQKREAELEADKYELVKERDDLKAKLAQVEAKHGLKWTSEPPTVPGWYWRRTDRLTTLAELGGMIYFVPEWDIKHWGPELRKFQWSGPIPEPQEPK